MFSRIVWHQLEVLGIVFEIEVQVDSLAASSCRARCAELCAAIFPSAALAPSENGISRHTISAMSSSEKPEFCFPRRRGSTTFCVAGCTPAISCYPFLSSREVNTRREKGQNKPGWVGCEPSASIGAQFVRKIAQLSAPIPSRGCPPGSQMASHSRLDGLAIAGAWASRYLARVSWRVFLE